jgi:hypothetical protein
VANRVLLPDSECKRYWDSLPLNERVGAVAKVWPVEWSLIPGQLRKYAEHSWDNLPLPNHKGELSSYISGLLMKVRKVNPKRLARVERHRRSSRARLSR